MSDEKYLQDLKEIREMMDKSTRFISLSGLSGVVAGIIALIAAALAYQLIYKGQNYFEFRQAELSASSLQQLLLLAICTIGLALLSAIYFTQRKAKRMGAKVWTKPVRSLLASIIIPMATGGIVALFFLLKGYVALMAPLTLIFYGLALLNASKYTLNEIKSLGLAQILLGLISLYFLGYGLLFWAIGFGLLHIVYGTLMHFRYQD